MGENAITTLFNRAALDSIAGACLLASLATLAAASNADPYDYLSSSPWERFSPWIVLVLAFLVGTLLDKATGVALDRNLFRQAFESRLATFELPTWCKDRLEKRVNVTTLDVDASGGADLIDDSRTDWVSAVFLAHGRTEALAKRADLVANFQFSSNLLVVGLVTTVTAPVALLLQGRWVLAIFACFALLGLDEMLRRASLAALRRVHTYENLIVFGMFLPHPGS